jgi:Holliday junction resolvase RusA-like endonuclease
MNCPESQKIKIKPLSVNMCWRGRRFKTPNYQSYEKELFFLLPKIKFPIGKIALDIEAGLSSKNADIDNIAKPFIDVMQKKYGFNDKNIYKLTLTKIDVKKGEEYVKFKVE